MSLPRPRAGSPPALGRLTAAAYAAILDDRTIDQDIRVAVLFDLENSQDPKAAFVSICQNEELTGPQLHSPATLQVGRAMPLDAFERGLTGGWFGADRMDATIARSLIVDIKSLLLTTSNEAKAVALIQALLDPGIPNPVLARRVTWYYYDELLPAAPLNHVAPDLAYRLALPSVWGKKITASSPIEFVVFAVSITSLDDPRKPRFTDCGVLDFLEIWRPGGATAPWIAGIIGLDEAVGPPTVIGRSLTGIRMTACHEP